MKAQSKSELAAFAMTTIPWKPDPKTVHSQPYVVWFFAKKQKNRVVLHGHTMQAGDMVLSAAIAYKVISDEHSRYLVEAERTSVHHQDFQDFRDAVEEAEEYLEAKGILSIPAIATLVLYRMAEEVLEKHDIPVR
jgi:hypothetical protein